MKSFKAGFALGRVLWRPPIPDDFGFIMFSSDNEFTLSLGTSRPGSSYSPTSAYGAWDGIIEYSVDAANWTEWEDEDGHPGGTVLNSSAGKLYLRGKGNTKITGLSGTIYGNADGMYIENRVVGHFVIRGQGVSCSGRITSLLDHRAVNPRRHGTANGIFYGLFSRCTGLIDASKLKFPRWVHPYEYANMFYGCTSLKRGPKLPAVSLSNAYDCYCGMFYGCSSLENAPELPATVLSSSCYSGMFAGCTSLKKAPALPAKDIMPDCYTSMFRNCISLTKTPELPAVNAPISAYAHMFRGCSSLTEIQAIAATSVGRSCCFEMFRDCKSLVKVPQMPATSLTTQCYCYMFQDCVSLATIPKLPAAILAEMCYYGMFYGCKSLKIAEQYSDEYCYSFQIPYGGDGSELPDGALLGMFTRTGGTFRGTPELNTIYYTTHPLV